MEIVMECYKHPTTSCAGLLKKLIKREYQLVFEFFNKVKLPRIEKRICATSTDLFIIESLCKFEPLDLPTLMLEHMYKIVVECKGSHKIWYEYL